MYTKHEVAEQPSGNFSPYWNPANVQDKLHADAEHLFSGHGPLTSQQAYDLAANKMRSF